MALFAHTNHTTCNLFTKRICASHMQCTAIRISISNICAEASTFSSLWNMQMAWSQRFCCIFSDQNWHHAVCMSSVPSSAYIDLAPKFFHLGTKLFELTCGSAWHLKATCVLQKCEIAKSLCRQFEQLQKITIILRYSVATSLLYPCPPFPLEKEGLSLRSRPTRSFQLNEKTCTLCVWFRAHPYLLANIHLHSLTIFFCYTSYAHELPQPPTHAPTHPPTQLPTNHPPTTRTHAAGVQARKKKNAKHIKRDTMANWIDGAHD